jgi:hypothetical protein
LFEALFERDAAFLRVLVEDEDFAARETVRGLTGCFELRAVLVNLAAAKRSTESSALRSR